MGVYVDWANDGDFSDTIDDITADVVSIDWQLGGSGDHVTAQNPGSATVRVQAFDGKYNPDNGSSVLTGKLKVGRPIWIGLGSDLSISGNDVGVFAGYVRKIIPGPVAGGVVPFADLVCEDALGSYGRRPVKVAAATTFSYGSLRAAVLSDIGEANTDLGDEIDTLPLADAISSSALAILEELNVATGSRHWTKPASSAASFYTYTLINRQYKLTQSATDDSINGDDVTALSGYEVTSENVVNYQEIDVSPVHFPPGAGDVWTYDQPTFGITTTPKTIWASFDDFVSDAALDYNSAGGAVTANLTNFGTTAKIVLSSASTSTITGLKITGRLVVRDPGLAVVAEDTGAQDDLGEKAASSVSPYYASVAPLAQGVADFRVWKFKNGLKTPAIEETNEPASITRSLYDIIDLTIDSLSVAARRFEIIGLEGHYAQDKSLRVVSYLQECPNQAALDLFILDTSLLDSDDQLAR